MKATANTHIRGASQTFRAVETLARLTKLMEEVSSHFEGDQLWRQLLAAPRAGGGPAMDSLSASELLHLRRLFEGRSLDRCEAAGSGWPRRARAAC